MARRTTLRFAITTLTCAWACGEADPTGLAPAAMVAPDTVGNGAVLAALIIDPAALPHYAGQTLPTTFGPQVLRREDGAIARPITDAGATLGRVLFFERRLSRNDSLACADCHRQALAFGDSARFSRGFEGGLAGAHTMRLANARFNESGQYFWDRRAPSLEAQVVQPIQNAVEMGFDASRGGLAAALANVASAPYYPRLFSLAFGDSAVSEDRVRRALAQYVRSIVAVRSRWDIAVAAAGTPPPFNQPLPTFTPQENQGLQLFMLPPNAGGAGCAGCHVPPTFSLAADSRSNGLDAGEATVFRSPSLRTIDQGTRYMHDGRFATLDEVVDFYDGAVQPGPALDNRLRLPTGEPRRLLLGPAQKAALVAFLRTLVDTSVTTDPRFSDPFRR